MPFVSLFWTSDQTLESLHSLFFVVVGEKLFGTYGGGNLISFSVSILRYFYRVCCEAFQGLQHKIGPCRTFILKGSSQHKVGGEWFEIKLGKISRMLVKYEVLPIPNVIFVC